MPKCPTFEVTVKGDVAKIVEDVKKEAAKKDIEVKGDAKAGTLRHKTVDIRGTYAVSGQKIRFDITEDTWMADCAKIKNGITEWFKGK